MRSDKDQRTEKMQEIDDFLAQFDNQSDDFTTDIDSYLDPSNTGRYTATKSPNSDKADKTVNEAAKNQSSDFSASSGKKHSSDNSGASVKKPKEKKAPKPKDPNRKFKYSDMPLELKGLSFKEKIKAIWKYLFFDTNPYYQPGAGEFVTVNGKKIKNKPLKFSLKKLFIDLVAAGLAMVLAFMLYALVVITMAPKIDAEDIYASVAESSEIYDDSGKKVDTVYYTENRDIVKYDELPKDLVNAFVAIEDKTFWKHHGFNWTRMVGAVVQSVVGGGSISGTSTITQQLARNVYLEDIKSVRSIKRKIIEMYYAGQIERCLEKEQIIEAYLNTIYLGFGCYGVQSASHAYFSKDVKDLTVLECAALASLPPAPDSYALVKYVEPGTVTDNTANIITTKPDTYIANDITKDRRDTTLKLMLDQGYIDKKTYESTKGTDLIKFIKPTFNSGSSTYSYFHDYVVDQVIKDLMKKYEMEYDDAETMVYSKGLKIYSTLDSQAQQVITREFSNSNNFPDVTGYFTDGNGNIVANGQVKMYGYDNYFDKNKNFILGSSECTINSDGSVTVKRGKRLNIYTTEYAGTKDYSLEFKSLFTKENGTLYNIPGGFINIPADMKKLDENDNLVIDAKFFKNNDAVKISGSTVIFTPNSYSLQQKVIQPQAAMVITEVGTGQIKAMVGGRSVSGKKLLNRTLSTRQPGSSIKPLTVYGSALQKSFELSQENKKWEFVDYGFDRQGAKGYGSYITTASAVVDERMTVDGKVWPQNAGGGYSGYQTFRTALQQSLNTCAVKILLQVTPEYSFKMLEKFGITTGVSAEDNKDTNDINPASLALGGLTDGVTPLQMSLAYAAFPNNGVRNTPIAYTKVVDRTGKTILKAKSKTHKVLDPGVAWIMTDCLKSNVTRGIAGSAYVRNVQSGGKTGTTDNQYDIWFDGFTPTYAASLWIGVDCNIALTSMSGPAASLWGKIMRQIDKACSGSYKDMPSNVVYTRGEYFTKGTESGLSNYKAELESNKKKELIAKVEGYMDREGLTLSQACAKAGCTVSQYISAGGTRREEIKKDEEEDKEPEEGEGEGEGGQTGGGQTGGGQTGGGQTGGGGQGGNQGNH